MARVNLIGRLLGGATDGALRLTRGDSNAFSVDFLDQSLSVTDTTTPANNYSGAPSGKLTITTAASSLWRNGVMTAISANMLPYDYDPITNVPKGLYINPTRTNLVLNSAALSTQNVTVTAAAHVLSFYGTGTITLTGVSTAGPLVGTGAGQRVQLAFTPTAGTLTLTVSGTVSYAQLEVGTGASSWIETAGSTVGRAADAITIDTTSMPWNDSKVTILCEFMLDYLPGTGVSLLSINNGTAQERHAVRLAGASIPNANTVDNNVNQASISIGSGITVGEVNRMVYAAEVNSAQAALNGVLGTEDTAITMPTPTVVRFGGTTAAAEMFPFYLRRAAVFCNTRKGNAEVQSLSVVS